MGVNYGVHEANARISRHRSLEIRTGIEVSRILTYSCHAHIDRVRTTTERSPTEIRRKQKQCCWRRTSGIRANYGLKDLYEKLGIKVVNARRLLANRMEEKTAF